MASHDSSGTWRTYDDALIYDEPLERLGAAVTPYIYLYSRVQLHDVPDFPVFAAMPAYESPESTPALVTTTNSTAAMVSDSDMPMVEAWTQNKRLSEGSDVPNAKATKIDSWESPKNSPKNVFVEDVKDHDSPK